MANHQTNFTSNFGEMGETGNAAFVLNVNGTSHTYHPVGSDVSVDVATVRRILATAPNLAQSIASVLAAGGYPILVYDGSEYGYIKTVNSRYVFTCLDSLNGVKQAEVDIQDGTITAGAGGVDGVSILSRTDSDLFLKITTALTLSRIPIILDSETYYHLIAKTSTVAQFGRITAAGALEVLTVNNSDQITSSSFTFVQDPYYVHTDNNFTNAYKTAVEANTTARHTHTNKSILDGIEQTDIDNWDGKLNPTGDASDTTSTFTKASGDTSSIASGGKLSAIFGAISSFFASLKALAFKDKASYNDLSSGVQSSLDKADSALQSHQSVTDNNPTLAWGATSTVGTVGGANLQVTMPSNPASGKQDTISDLADIRSGAAAGASALQPSGNGSNLSVTPDGTSTGYDLGSSTTLKAFAQKFKNLVGALKTLAFKDEVSTGDISDDAITADKVKDNETLPVNISGKAARATMASKSIFYTSNSTGNYTRYLRIGNIESSQGSQKDCIFLATTPDGVGDNIPTTYIVTASNRFGSHLVRYSRITPEKNTSERLASFGYVLQSDGSIDIMMYRPKYSGTTNITMIREGDLVSNLDENADGANYVAGNRYETVMVSRQVGSPATPVYVDADGQVQPCTPSSMYVGWASNVNLSKTVNAVNGDSIQAGTGASVTIGNAGNAKKWDGYAISVGTVVSSAGTISIA